MNIKIMAYISLKINRTKNKYRKQKAEKNVWICSSITVRMQSSVKGHYVIV